MLSLGNVILLIPTLLDNVDSWALHIVLAYTSAEVHSMKGSPGDIADVGIFSNNADKTVFEFLESFELGYIDQGNNQQCASKLFKHLTDDPKDKLMTTLQKMTNSSEVTKRHRNQYID